MGCTEPIPEQDINASILSTRREIAKIQSDIDSTEHVLNEMKKHLDETPSNAVKEEAFKNQLFNKIKEYKRLINYKNALEKNLAIMERKKLENRVVGVIEGNQGVLGDIGNNDEKIRENIYNVNLQNQQLESNDKLFEEAGRSNLTKYEIDAEINNFFKK